MSAEFVVVCGLSGAGRTQAAANFEDLGWFVIDNVPPALIPKLGELAAAPGSTYDQLALVVRIGAEGPVDTQRALKDLTGIARRVRILFLDAASDVLIRRYEASRRRHPLATENITVADAIERERQLLQPLKEDADVVIDTGNLTVHQLRERIHDLFGEDQSTAVRVNVSSFGYKHGLPLDVDLVLDCRFLPNPHWIDELRPLTGLDDAVRDYVLKEPDAQAFLEDLDSLLGTILPAYAREGRTYLSIALGCTGGRHRSVAMAGAVAELLRGHGYHPSVTHRDVEK